MKKNDRILAATLAGCLVLGSAGTVYAGETDAATYTKYENVYANLDATGDATDAYIVNHFSVTDAGDIIDYGSYENVKNLTTLDDLTKNANSVEFHAADGEFYYQGKVKEVQLPWNFTIRYELDGKEVTSDELAGKNGKLKIIFHSTRNDAVENDFYDRYLLQVSLTLDCTKAKNIVAKGATIADAGADRQISFTALPGNDADFVIEADVNHFTMSGFSIAAVPYSMEIDSDEFDLDDFTGQISELTAAVEKLKEGTDSLEDGLTQLCDKNADIQNGANQLQNGLNALSDNSTSLVDASSQIKNALDTISSQLAKVDFNEMSELSELPGGLTKLADALDGVKDGLTTLNTSYTTAFETLDKTIQEDTNTLTENELDALQKSVAGNEDATAAYQKLLASYKQLQTIKATYQNVKPAFEAVSSALNSESETSVITGIATISESIRGISNSLSGISETDIAGQMDTLKNGLTSLASQYSAFHSGLSTYTEGVDSISENFGTFQNGITSYLNGTEKIKDGAGQLSGGMEQFADGIHDMPTEVENTIDKWMGSFSDQDYQAVSFMSDKNEDITSVQFVISTKGIEMPESQKVTENETKQGFWERLKALFVK